MRTILSTLNFIVTGIGGYALLPTAGENTPGVARIPGPDFVMGSDLPGSRANEKPLVQVSLESFRLDEQDVTNAQFLRFAQARGCKTTAARAVDSEELKKQLPAGTPKPPEEQLKPGFMVFKPPPDPVDLRDMNPWWRWLPAATWQYPEGPGSDLERCEQDPVVQVSWDEAVAYARWDGKRLPTEAEWEMAARGGLSGKRFGWGDELKPGGKFLANTWTGTFPNSNTKEDGHSGISPVESYPPNGYGLYNMVGNVWNWVSDWYWVNAHARMKLEPSCHNPTGPKFSYNPGHPDQTQKRVTKGGSFLCLVDYCESYRSAARRGTPPETGRSHIGFCWAYSQTSGTPRPRNK